MPMSRAEFTTEFIDPARLAFEQADADYLAAKTAFDLAQSALTNADAVRFQAKQKLAQLRDARTVIYGEAGGGI